MASSKKKCSRCRGTGRFECVACGGTGEQAVQVVPGSQKMASKCGSCKGTGKRPCSPCGGTGEIG